MAFYIQRCQFGKCQDMYSSDQLSLEIGMWSMGCQTSGFLSRNLQGALPWDGITELNIARRLRIAAINPLSNFRSDTKVLALSSKWYITKNYDQSVCEIWQSIGNSCFHSGPAPAGSECSVISLDMRFLGIVISISRMWICPFNQPCIRHLMTKSK